MADHCYYNTPYADHSTIQAASQHNTGVVLTTNQGTLKAKSKRHKDKKIRSPYICRKHPTYHGIRYRNGKWVSEVREPKKSTRIWLGTYHAPEMAAAAYDVAALTLKGTTAKVNFPNRKSTYPVPVCASPESIRKAAAEAAGYTHVSNVQSEFQNDGCEHWNIISGIADYKAEEYVDDDALFNVPNLLIDIANGMIIPPPEFLSLERDDWSYDYSNSLWSF